MKNQTDRLEDLVRKQGDEIKWLQTEMSKQADVIKRLLPLEAEVTNMKGHSQRVDKRLLGIHIFAIIVIFLMEFTAKYFVLKVACHEWHKN